MVTYDKHYQEKKYFGNPIPALIRFFRQNESKGRVLDLGCGQGRDSLALARLGYTVVGVDISKVGIEQMLAIAGREKLNVKGVVADIYEFVVSPEYDIVLLDSMLHFYKKDKKKESQLLQGIIANLKLNGMLCILINKSKTAEAILERVLRDSNVTWTILQDTYTDYPEFKTVYRMLVIQKA